MDFVFEFVPDEQPGNLRIKQRIENHPGALPNLLIMQMGDRIHAFHEFIEMMKFRAQHKPEPEVPAAAWPVFRIGHIKAFRWHCFLQWTDYSLLVIEDT